MSVKEKRQFQRFPFDARAIVRRGDGEWHTELLDISLKGVLVRHPDEFNVKLHEKLHIDVIFSNTQTLITADVSLAHAEAGRIGFKVEMIDIESISHLRRLVELNLGNSDLLERELAHLISVHASD